MSNTVALTIYTSSYPSITNNIQINVYAQSAPSAIVASLNYAGPHGYRTWSFPGLPLTNYLFRIFEMSGSTIVQQLGDDMDVVPGSASSVNYKSTEQIRADFTPGLVSNTNTFSFDGTSGKEDWRGFDIATIDRLGIGPMKKGVDYSWNISTGVFTLLNSGDVFAPNEWFNVDFALQVGTTTSSVPASVPLFATPIIKNSNYTINAGTDMGGLIILDPSSNYMELTFPNITTVVPGKLITIEMRRSASNKCAKMIFQTGQTLDWMLGSRSNLYICPNETISFYRFTDPGTSADMWRIYAPFGNFLRVGEQISDDNVAANVFNKVMFNGSSVDTQQFARLYNDYVLSLPSSQYCNYDDWSTGNNKYLFSLANSSNPANAGKFMLPDRRGMFERISSASRSAGSFEAQSVQAHPHPINGGGLGPGVVGIAGPGKPNNGISGGGHDGGSYAVTQTDNNTGLETRPNNIAINKYILV